MKWTSWKPVHGLNRGRRANQCWTGTWRRDPEITVGAVLNGIAPLSLSLELFLRVNADGARRSICICSNSKLLAVVWEIL
ncbi:hypothetical protein CaCOL14_008397 [Colletotrichum acutatum]